MSAPIYTADGSTFMAQVEDYSNGYNKIDYVVGGEKTEAGRNRMIPSRPEGRKHFAYFAARAKGPVLISGYAGQQAPANFRKRDDYPLLKKLEIKRKTPHATRHTYTSWVRKTGIAPEVLQKILGHADYSTMANIYVHTDAEELIAAVERSVATNTLQAGSD